MNYCFCGGRRDDRLPWRRSVFVLRRACEGRCATRKKWLVVVANVFFLVLILKSQSYSTKRY